MIKHHILFAASAMLALAACGNGEPAPAPVVDTPPALHESLQGVAAGAYSLERSHAFLSFRVPHGNGLSQYRVALTDFDADLTFDPANPESSTLSVTINPMGVQTNYPGDYKATHADSAYESWNEDLARSPAWLNADAHPQITFTSTSVTRTGDQTGTVTGDLTFLGQTKPVTLNVTYNGVANAPWFGERDLIGFNATTTLTRSEWGMTTFLPLVGDEVTIAFSGEFLQDE